MAILKLKSYRKKITTFLSFQEIAQLFYAAHVCLNNIPYTRSVYQVADILDDVEAILSGKYDDTDERKFSYRVITKT